MRDFLYVKDAVEMTLHFAEKGASAAGLYNLGSGAGEHLADPRRGDLRALGREPKVEFIDMPETLRAKYQYFTQADISKLRATGYDRPVTPLPTPSPTTSRNYLVPEKRLGD